LNRSASEKRATRRGGLAAVQIVLCICRDEAEGAGRQPGLLAGGLLQHREQALAHLGVSRVDRGRAVVADLDHRLAILWHPVSNADVLDPAPDAGVFRASVRLLDGLQSLFQSDAAFELLARAKAIAHVERVEIA